MTAGSTQIRPSDLPTLRDGAIEYTRKFGQQSYDHYAALNGEEAIRSLPRFVLEAFTVADLYCITGPMVELSLQAGKTLFPEFRLTPEDMPGPCGMACFQDPIHYVISDGGKGRLPIVGALWFPLAERISIVWLVDRHHEDFAAISFRGNRITAVDVRRRGASRIMPYGYMAIVADGNPNGLTMLGDPDPGDQSPDMYKHVATLKAAWLLMGQPLAQIDDVKVGRPGTRKGGRTIKRSVVRVVSLRRPLGQSDGGQSAREWHHRWIVKGHWRMQPWGPRRERVRPVWISPYVKGPEDKPMIGGEKVYHLKQ